MLTNNDSLAQWLRRERTQLGLSTRDLARLAGVSYPTVSRIENGHEQPRWATLQKMFAVLGQGLAPMASERDQLRLADLSEAWMNDATATEHPDWTQLKALADQMSLRPALIAQAIYPEPPRSQSALMDNLLAAIAEKIADDAGIARPRWTRTRPGRKEPWSPPGRTSKQTAGAAAIPTQFARRGLLVPASAIWRERPLVLA